MELLVLDRALGLQQYAPWLGEPGAALLMSLRAPDGTKLDDVAYEGREQELAAAIAGGAVRLRGVGIHESPRRVQADFATRGLVVQRRWRVEIAESAPRLGHATVVEGPAPSARRSARALTSHQSCSVVSLTFHGSDSTRRVVTSARASNSEYARIVRGGVRAPIRCCDTPSNVTELKNDGFLQQVERLGRLDRRSAGSNDLVIRSTNSRRRTVVPGCVHHTAAELVTGQWMGNVEQHDRRRTRGPEQQTESSRFGLPARHCARPIAQEAGAAIHLAGAERRR